MKINWAKWILERLPFSLRVNRVYVFCILLTLPIRQLHASFVEWGKKMRNRAGTSPQVCMLIKTIYDELGVNIEIDEGNGKPYDFIVKTAPTDDKKKQILALLNKYKIAGKWYEYVDGTEITFETTWTDFVCEQCEYSSNWDSSSYICEQKSKIEIYLEIRPYYSGDYLIAEIKPSQALPNDIWIVFDSYSDTDKFTEKMLSGQVSARTFKSPKGFELRSISLIPIEDYDYKYIINNI